MTITAASADLRERSSVRPSVPPLLRRWAGRPVDYAADPWFRFRRVLDVVDTVAVIPSGASWLDVGCQMGQFLALLRAEYAVDGWGIDDFAPQRAVEVCRRYLNLDICSSDEVLDGSWRYFQRQIERDGFAIEAKFLFISALEVIEHMVDTDAFIAECRNHLAADGYLVLTTPNINSLRNRVGVPLGRYPSGLEYRTVNHHVRLYNAEALKSHVESFGFRLRAMRGVSFLPRSIGPAGNVRDVLDRVLSNACPSLCGNLIAVFQRIS